MATRPFQKFFRIHDKLVSADRLLYVNCVNNYLLDGMSALELVFDIDIYPSINTHYIPCTVCGDSTIRCIDPSYTLNQLTLALAYESPYDLHFCRIINISNGIEYSPIED